MSICECYHHEKGIVQNETQCQYQISVLLIVIGVGGASDCSGESLQFFLGYPLLVFVYGTCRFHDGGCEGD